MHCGSWVPHDPQELGVGEQLGEEDREVESLGVLIAQPGRGLSVVDDELQEHGGNRRLQYLRTLIIGEEVLRKVLNQFLTAEAQCG